VDSQDLLLSNVRLSSALRGVLPPVSVLSLEWTWFSSVGKEFDRCGAVKEELMESGRCPLGFATPFDGAGRLRLVG
jgi:hypothetical protein